jgi:hypothetical protein
MRSFALALVALAFASPAFAADRPADTAPEKLLPPTTQLFVRWDGIAAHRDAYKNSFWGGVMAGPTGDSVRALLARAPKLLGSSVLAEPLLDGKPPAELKASLADLKAVEKVADLIADKGVLFAVEVREPGPSIKGIGQAIGGLVGGKMPGPEALMPDAQVIVIVPDVGDRADVLFGTLRMVMKKAEVKTEPFGPKGFQIPPEGNGPIALNAAWWVEGTHFVFYAGTRKPADVAAELTANVAKGGVTGHPLFQRCLKTGDFESVTRGFIDTERVINLAKSLAGPFVPGLKERLDSTGISGLKAVVFSSGFEGKEARALYEFDVPGERKGIAKVLKNVPLGVNDLPPMPPDVSRFSALRLDFPATYDAGLGLVEFLTMAQEFGVEEDAGKKNIAALIKARKEYLAREADKFLGISVADDLLPHLGDKLVVFQSPTEGLQVFGTVVCISVKDAAKVKTAADRVQRALEAIANSPCKHLFPNLTVTRDDGKTIRVEVNESISLPLEVVGAEPFAFAILLGLRF